MANSFVGRMILHPSSDGEPEPEVAELASRVSERKKAHTKRWDRCVSHVDDKGGKYNPYAVCTGRMKRERAFLKSSRDRAKKKRA